MFAFFRFRKSRGKSCVQFWFCGADDLNLTVDYAHNFRLKKDYLNIYDLNSFSKNYRSGIYSDWALENILGWPTKFIIDTNKFSHLWK